MSQTEALLDYLAALTAARDSRNLELSLLKTLHSIFAPDALSLIQLDSRGEPLFLQHYDAADNLLVYQPPESLDTYLPWLQGLLQTSAQGGFSCMLEGQQLLFYPVLELRQMNICLILRLNRSLAPEDDRLIHSFLEVYRNFCALLEDAQTDELTGLLNRKTFDKNFQSLAEALELDAAHSRSAAQIVRERRSGKPSVPAGMDHYWLAVIDIDHFKQVNDRFGHIYGDEVLILLAQLMRSCFRTEDLLYRFGGEEFVVIARCNDQAGAHKVFERFRQMVAAYNFPQIGQVTVSIGVVQLRRESLATPLFDQADQALYHAKSHGRNQVRFYQELVDRQLIRPVELQLGEMELF